MGTGSKCTTIICLSARVTSPMCSRLELMKFLRSIIASKSIETYCSDALALMARCPLRHFQCGDHWSSDATKCSSEGLIAKLANGKGHRPTWLWARTASKFVAHVGGFDSDDLRSPDNGFGPLVGQDFPGHLSVKTSISTNLLAPRVRSAHRGVDTLEYQSPDTLHASRETAMAMEGLWGGRICNCCNESDLPSPPMESQHNRTESGNVQ